MERDIFPNMTIQAINDDIRGERMLAVEAARYYISQCVNDKAQERYDKCSDGEILSIFLWKRYLEGRAWLTNHKALSCCLRLRQAFMPWEIRRKDISQ